MSNIPIKLENIESNIDFSSLLDSELSLLIMPDYESLENNIEYGNENLILKQPLDTYFQFVDKNDSVYIQNEILNKKVSITYSNKEKCIIFYLKSLLNRQNYFKNVKYKKYNKIIQKITEYTNASNLVDNLLLINSNLEDYEKSYIIAFLEQLHGNIDNSRSFNLIIDKNLFIYSNINKSLSDVIFLDCGKSSNFLRHYIHDLNNEIDSDVSKGFIAPFNNIYLNGTVCWGQSVSDVGEISSKYLDSNRTNAKDRTYSSMINSVFNLFCSSKANNDLSREYLKDENHFEEMKKNILQGILCFDFESINLSDDCLQYIENEYMPELVNKISTMSCFNNLELLLIMHMFKINYSEIFSF